MASKVVDVTLLAMSNTGSIPVSPFGMIACKVARAVDDEQIFHSEVLFFRETNQPLHSSGAIKIAPGETLVFNETKRFTVLHFEQEAEGQLNQNLIFSTELVEVRREFSETIQEFYFGFHNKPVFFDEIEGTKLISLTYSATAGTKIIEIEFIVNLISTG